MRITISLMAKLKGGFGKLATVGEVFDVLYRHLTKLEAETIQATDSLHRVLASDVRSEIDVPHFEKAAMDGYAVRAEDTFGAGDSNPRVLQVIDSLMPGSLPSKNVSPDAAIEIGTGAPMPPGANAVVMVEYTESTADDRVSVRKPVAPAENTIAVGSDVAAQSVVLAAGTSIEPRHIGVLAAIGAPKVEVLRRIRVALFSTGPEIVEIDQKLEPGKIFDINTHTLRAALIADMCEVVDLGIVPDDAKELDDAITKGLESADFILLSGGSSLGGGDLVGEAFTRAGQMLIHGAAVKPGKPIVIGTSGEKLMIGLPGYPMSALSDYYIFVRPFIRRVYGLATHEHFVEARLARKHPSTVGRYEFLPVRLENGEAVPLTKGSSAISALADADGFVEIDENTEVVDAGATVKVRLF